MARSRNLARAQVSSAREALRRDAPESVEIAASLAELHSQYGKHAIPDAELRRLMDEAMGNESLTEELYRMREGK